MSQARFAHWAYWDIAKRLFANSLSNRKTVWKGTPSRFLLVTYTGKASTSSRVRHATFFTDPKSIAKRIARCLDHNEQLGTLYDLRKVDLASGEAEGYPREIPISHLTESVSRSRRAGRATSSATIVQNAQAVLAAHNLPNYTISQRYLVLVRAYRSPVTVFRTSSRERAVSVSGSMASQEKALVGIWDLGYTSGPKRLRLRVRVTFLFDEKIHTSTH